jgi:hypothetical protein
MATWAGSSTRRIGLQRMQRSYWAFAIWAIVACVFNLAACVLALWQDQSWRLWIPEVLVLVSLFSLWAVAASDHWLAVKLAKAEAECARAELALAELEWQSEQRQAKVTLREVPRPNEPRH